MKKIGFYSRDETYGWLSNFHRCIQIVDGEIYPTNEHYYQSQKANLKEFHNWIKNAPNPYHAMKAGRTLRANKGELKTNWDDIKLEVMLKGLRSKFIDTGLRHKLLDTGDAYLFENSPNDRFWGEVRGEGKNHLGRLLMQVRQEILSSKQKGIDEK